MDPQAPVTSFSEQTSKLRFYSLGIAAENKEKGSKELLVTPIEVLTLLDGEIGSDPSPSKAQGIDADGNTYQTTVTKDRAIPCTWFPMQNTNRRTAPDVRRGERVMILVFADRNEYVWVSLGMDDNLRKLETVTYTISGTADEEVDGTLPGNCYMFEMSSDKGLVTFSTSKVNGEVASYCVQIDAKGGRIAFGDDKGNYLKLDTKETSVEMVNSYGTTMKINKSDFLLKGKKGVIDVDNLTVTGKSSFLKQMQASGIVSPAYPIKGPVGEI